MSEQTHNGWLVCVKRWTNPLLSWVSAGSLLGALEGIWKVRDWSYSGPWNFQFWVEFSAGRLLFVLSALSLYGMLFGLLGIISIALSRAILPLLSPSDRYSVHIPLGLILLFWVEDILVIIPHSSLEAALYIGLGVIILSVAVKGNQMVSAGQKRAFIRWMYILAAGLILLFIVVRFTRADIYWLFTQRKASILLVLAFSGTAAWLLHSRWRVLWKPQLIGRVVPVIFLLGSVFFLAAFNSLFLSDSFAPNFFSNYLSGKDKPKVIFIVVDTLRADHLGMYGYGRRTSPQLDKWAQKGLVMENAVAPSSWTVPSTFSILTGLLPQRHGILHSGINIKPSFPMIPKVFSEEGYFTAAFVANGILSMRSDFYDMIDDFRGKDIYPKLWGESLIRQMTLTKQANIILKWDVPYLVRKNPVYDVIDRLNKDVEKWLSLYADYPFFLYLHYMDPHAPYDTHEKALKKIVPADDPFASYMKEAGHADTPEDIYAYDCEIRFVDHHLNRLFLKLQDMGIWDNSLVVLTSDHGEAFGEHGYNLHANSLYQEEVHVPLIFFSTKRFPFSGRFSPYVSLVDIAPTVLDLMGIQKEIDSDGMVLSSWIRNPAKPLMRDVYSFLAAIRGKIRNFRYFQSVYTQNRWKHITKRDRSLQEKVNELYDLQSDPGEKVNLVIDRPQISEMMGRKLTQNRRDISLDQVRSPETPLHPGLREALKSLGYLN